MHAIGATLTELWPLVDKHVVYVDGADCTPGHPCLGADAMRNNVQLFVAQDAYSSTTGVSNSSDAVVDAQLENQSPGRAAMGLDRTLSDVRVEVRDGRIVSWRSVNEAADPQTARWLDHQP
jgi:hypothetical protein